MLGRTFEVASPKRTKKLSFADSTETIPQLPSDSTNPRIKINVGGVIYEIRKHTLERYPETLLGNPQRRNRYFDETRKELFFERNQIVFNAILNFYIKKGELRRPQNVSIEAFFEEIRFFDLGELALKRWFKREKLFENQLVLPKDPSRLRLWKFLEDPSSSFGAKIFALVNFIVTFLAVTANCVETVPGVQGKISNRFTGSSSNNTTGDGIAQSSKFARFYKTFDVFFGIDLVCVIFFTLELSLRFIVSPIKKRFFLQGKNLIDLLSIIPFFVEVIYMYVGISAESLHSSMTLLSQLRVIRLLRVVRVLKFTQQFRGVRILVETVIASMWEIGLLTMILLICTLIFSAAVYYAEASEKDTQFISIPGSFYWSVVSMTSLGYGDIVPHGPLGRLVACLATAIGSIIISLNVPAVARNFDIIRQRLQSEQTIHRLLVENTSMMYHLSDTEETDDQSVLTRKSTPKESESVNGAASNIHSSAGVLYYDRPDGDKVKESIL